MTNNQTQNYARIENGVVVEVIALSSITSPHSIYSKEVASEFIKAPNKIEVNWRFIDGKWIEPITLTLDNIKQSLKSTIDHSAETERLKYITPGIGQAMTYTEKVNQAANYSKSFAAHLSAPDTIKAPNENEYLLLKSSLGIDGDTLAEAAENITWAYALWEQIGAAIETIRLQTKALIDAAETAQEAHAIFDAVKWP